ncbi:MAG: molybdate ABC transporter substrate-binding protein [Syntrophobacterales bacterium]|nr:molybdate ABC transporter substrate-binding protein [Syntrophobacterales bacterium]
MGEKTMVIEVWHADSLAGPVGELKRAFEAANSAVTVNTVSGRSRELAGRIENGERCDVFASSAPAIIEEMFKKRIGNRPAASWYAVFSSNELVVITKKGNPCGLRKMTDLAREGITLARVTGENDLAAGRTVEFIQRASEFEGNPDLAQKIIAGAAPERTIPDVLRAVQRAGVEAGIVYRSAAVTIAGDVEILSFPAAVNLSEKIRNAVTIPGTVGNEAAAIRFVRFMLSAEGGRILLSTGQPPLIPPLKEGDIPREIELSL